MTNDATALRKHIENHSKHLNHLDQSTSHRERIAHTWLDIFGGLIVGASVGYAVFYAL